ncbi:MAG TPA: hypothetical protein VIL37_08210 [Natronosporangium sp.]
MNPRIPRPWFAAVAAAIVATLLVLPGQPATAHQDRDGGRGGGPITPKELEFRNDMRMLWEDHIVWTRMAIVSFAADLPDFPATAERLLRNQDDIGAAFAAFYGRRAGDELTGLLREHILIAVDVLTAAKAGDQPALDDALARWDGNAVAIATSFNSVNPRHWKLAEMTAMMRDHLALTTEEAVARLTGDTAADIAAYDAVHEQAMAMADMLSTGIIAQFPHRFRGHHHHHHR